MRLSVRRGQMVVMDAVAEANFERDVARHIRSEYGDSIVRLPEGDEHAVKDLSEDALEGLVKVGIAKARCYELTRQSSIACFVAMMFSGAPNFDLNRLCEVLLADEEKTPDERTDEIPNVLSEKNWEAIRNDYDPSAWVLLETTNTDLETTKPNLVIAGTETKEPSDPLARTVTGKTLSKIAKKPKDTVDIQPQYSKTERDIDVNTVKIDRDK